MTGQSVNNKRVHRSSKEKAEILKKLQIRSFTLHHYEAVVALWREGKVQLKKSDERKEIEKKLDKDPDLFLVATLSSQLAGVVMGSWDGRRGWVNHMVVKGRFQGCGIATMLLKELEERLKSKGCFKINILIAAGDASVLDLYTKLKYKTEYVMLVSKII